MRRLQLSLSKMLMFFRKGRVRSKIFGIIVAVITVPLLALGLVLVRSAQSAIHRSVDHDRQELAKRAGAEISLFVSKPKDILIATSAMLSTVYPSPWKQETVLVELTLEQPVFLNVSSIDTSGTILAYSELGRQPEEYPVGITRALFSEHAPFFMSEVRVRDNHIPFVTIAVPVKKAGVTMGALVADVNVHGIWDIVDSITLGTTGRAFLIAENGVILAHPDKKKVLKQERMVVPREAGNQAERKTRAAHKDAAGSAWVRSYAPVAGTDWVIGLEQNRKEAYSFSRLMTFESWIMILLGEIIAVLGGLYVSRRLARPIESLLDRINVMSGGPGRQMDKDELREVYRSLKVIADELKNAREKERFTSLGEAASWIAHEMKNCLVSIKSFVQIFPQKHKDARFVEAFNRLIPGEIRRWERMLKDLADFTAAQACGRAPLDICRLVGQILQIMEYELKARQVDLIFTADGTGIMIQGDEERLKQVFVNLVLNAAQAMESGGKLTVSIEQEPGERSSVIVRVADTGKGILPADMQRIFEPFFTTGTGKGGMGLGLAISRRIVEEHGGKISVRSVAGAGATFSIHLPLFGFENGIKREVRRLVQKGETGQ